MFGLEVTQVAVTPQLAKDILTTAVEAGHTHGFGYWGHATVINRDADQRVVFLRIVENEAYDKDTPIRSRDVHLEHIAPAIRQMLNHDHKWASRLFDDDGLDGPLAEAIVQYICFGDVIYG